jgi:hypothetical protein
MLPVMARNLEPVNAVAFIHFSQMEFFSQITTEEIWRYPIIECFTRTLVIMDTLYQILSLSVLCGSTLRD